MNFVTALALGLGLLISLPYLAHRLQRREAATRDFAPARLVPQAEPKARRRARLEDRALLGLRALAIALLAVLGATPLVRCSRLSLARPGGASLALAIVVDDSLSMQAPVGTTTQARFARAIEGAKELMGSAAEGDSVAIVTAGAPARVVLPPTTDRGRAGATLATLTVTDRATDLEGAIAMARALLEKQPQTQKRIVLLSDLADGNSGALPLATEGIPLWAPLTELQGASADCAIVAASRSGVEVRVREQCSPGGRPRALKLFDGDKVVASGGAATASDAPASDAPASDAPASDAPASDILVKLPSDAPYPTLRAVLDGKDAIVSDDEAPVVSDARPGVLATYTEVRDDALATGGAPVIDRALAALDTPLSVRALTSLPDTADEFETFAAVIVDDPGGFTPEQRRHLVTFLEKGGSLLLGIGPRASRAPLGASFEPVLSAPFLYRETRALGLDSLSEQAFGGASSGLSKLAARARAELSPADVALFNVTARWNDGEPFLLRRTIGRGEVWLVTLPFALEPSELALRPGFLSMIDAFASSVMNRRTQTQGEVGTVWNFSEAAEVRGPQGLLPLERRGAPSRNAAASAPTTAPRGLSVRPDKAGRYVIKHGTTTEERVLFAPVREIDLRPRALASGEASRSALGETRAPVDLSWVIALVLLVVFTGELGLRAWLRKENAERPALA